jgi:small subunit ribosomal protein S1
VLTVGKHAGFCFGVKRAIDTAFASVEEGPCYTLGPLIHNPQVVGLLEARGAHTVDTPEEIPPGATVILRSHGVGPQVIQACRARGLKIVDATCPHVSRVHQLVSDYSQSGDPVILVGGREHPEVRGIAGWAKGPVYIVFSREEAEALPEMERALVVAQTTITRERFHDIVAALQARVRELTCKDTICQATALRQAEAARISGLADAMLVVGGRNSSNTHKLFETCLSQCSRTLLVETANDIPTGYFSPRDHIGITAGASTPEWLLKEVVTRMNDMEKDQVLEQADFMAVVEKTLVKIRPGQTVTGTVVQITDDEVCVNIGYKSDGLIKKADLTSTDCQIGDEIEVEVVKVNDGEGNVVLSQRNIVNRKYWEALMEKYEAGEYVEGKGKEAVKGGLIADVMGVRAFIPASQLSQRYVEKIDEFVGKDMTLKIIEVDKQKKRIVCSRKAYLTEESAAKKKEAWEKLKEGDVVKGIVRRLTDFGAFVDIGGVDGLIHVTDLAWHRVKHPSEIVTPNQEVEVVIRSLDAERERIQLGYKQLQPRPWDVAPEKYPVGAIVEGKVVRITTFGAFVELEPGLDGLVHISQCALTRIAKVEDAVKVGDVVRVKVLSVDPANQRISLSIREALEEEAFNYEDEIPGDDLGLEEVPSTDAE